MNRVKDKVAIVTGAAMGIGKAAAVALAHEGAKVAVADINIEQGQATVKEIQAAGGEAFHRRTDVGITADVAELVEATVARYGKLDILVNNVGIAIPGSVTDTTEEMWAVVLNVNLTSVWRGMKFAIPHMIKNGGGSIINMSSVQAFIGFQGWAAYSTSKGGINTLTQQAAVDYAKQGIRVNALAPGTIMTPMNAWIFETSPDPQKMIDNWTSIHPLGRLGQPDEVAAAILFLASDEASFITGEILRIDGGMVIRGG
jgi:NAD(P)-dependent dehydrogenase (short-subunit alcohol dehydrogenase family)